MTTQNILNLAGLVINMIGAYMMYHYTPKASSQIFFYSDKEQPKQKDIHNNKMIRFGMFLLFIGFIVQLIAMFITS
jgi:multisubunit Na+/H+ antiporter MnhB subunit